MILKLERLNSTTSYFTADGRPTIQMQLLWERNCAAIEANVNGIQAALDAAAVATTAAATANTAAAAATTAASTAQTAATTAQAATDATSREAEIANSYISPPSVLSSSTVLITVAAHTRTYPTATGPVSVAVSGGSVSATGAGPVVNYVSYSDPARAGGTVTYIASTTAPTQTGDVHVVGAITVPAAGTATGGTGPRRPGYVEP